MPRATSFACQTGYFRSGSILPYSGDIRRMLSGGGRFTLVCGANEERLTASDLEDVYDLVKPWLPGNRRRGDGLARFALVADPDILFHPKTVHLELDNGLHTALVGSANLTVPGLERNVEAGLVVDSVEDDPAVLRRIRLGIEYWFSRGSAFATLLHELSVINEIADEDVIEPSRFTPRARRSSRPSFRRRQRRMPGMFPTTSDRPRAPRRTPPASRFPIPAGRRAAATGVVKVLSPKSDLKTFIGGPGTPYISLPKSLGPLLPLTPAGRRTYPTMRVFLEGRLSGATHQVANSGRDTTGITWVGGPGSQGPSHENIRLDVHHSMGNELIEVAQRSGAALPSGGDPVAIEVLDNGRFLRLTFVTDDPLRTALLDLCSSPNRGGWGWLPAGLLPPWPAQR